MSTQYENNQDINRNASLDLQIQEELTFNLDKGISDEPSRVSLLKQQLQECDASLLKAPKDRDTEILQEMFNIRIPNSDLVATKVERLALMKLEYGPVHLEVVKALVEIGQAYIVTNACSSAIPHLEKALKLNHTLLSNAGYSKKLEEMTRVIVTVMALARFKMGELEKAESVIKKAQDLNLELHDQSDQSNFPIFMILGQIYAEYGMVEEAEASFTSAWEIKEQLDPDHYLLSTVYLELGRVYREAGKFKQAIELLERAKILTEKVRGKRSIDVAHISYLLTDLYSEINQFDNALINAELAYETIKYYNQDQDRLWTRHFVIWKLHVQIAYACSLIHNQRYQAAAPLLDHVISIDEGLYGDKYLSTTQRAFCYKMLGTVWMLLNEMAEAYNCWRNSIRLYAKAKGVRHEEVNALVHRLARIRVELSRQQVGDQ